MSYGFGGGGIVNILMLVLLGALALSNTIVQKKPNAKELLAKLAKASGIIGLIAGIWGVVSLVQSLININWMSVFFLAWLTGFATALVFVGLGFIYGFPVVAAFLSESAKGKAERMRQKVTGFQVLLGWISLGLAVWWLVISISPGILFPSVGALVHLR
jgi:hypothetical protein